MIVKHNSKKNINHLYKYQSNHDMATTILHVDIQDMINQPKNQPFPNAHLDIDALGKIIEKTIQKWGGIIYKPKPGSILALFNNTSYLHQNHAEKAVTAAYAIMGHVIILNQQRNICHEDLIKIGLSIGASGLSKEKFSINVQQGSPQFKTAFSHVTQMSRLNKEAPIHTIFISSKTKQSLEQTKLGPQLDDLGKMMLQGIDLPVHIYALLHGQLP